MRARDTYRTGIVLRNETHWKFKEIKDLFKRTKKVNRNSDVVKELMSFYMANSPNYGQFLKREI